MEVGLEHASATRQAAGADAAARCSRCPLMLLPADAAACGFLQTTAAPLIPAQIMPLLLPLPAPLLLPLPSPRVRASSLLFGR